jgi:hypothetical protein
MKVLMGALMPADIEHLEGTPRQVVSPWSET